ncbi:hypothetical protein V5O48_004882 [Marasmius crinis-equi]|uniref:BRCT domain-containing protein n=1 Tax=Marasmius crinis-equi TaxID=585013 RepID=A0ABR3FNV5_9AGAR
MFNCNCRNNTAHEEIFVRDKDTPLNFIVHISISDPKVQEALYNTIVDHGGDVLETDENVDYVLFAPGGQLTMAGYQNYFKFSADPGKRKVLVKDTQFIQDTLDDPSILRESIIPRRKPGFPAGKRRTEFTPEEEEKLCEFLAVTCPAGGRLSHNLYVSLCANAQYGEGYEWTKAHPPQAWRERYKKNKARLDPKIARYIIDLQVHPNVEDEDEDEEEERPPPDEGSDRHSPVSRQKKRGDTNEDDHDSLFSGEDSEERPDEDAGPDDVPVDQEEEDEVDNALQLISNYTDDQPRASTSRLRLAPDEESVNASLRIAPIPKKWPPDRRRKRLSGVVTAPPAPTVQGSRPKSGKSSQGKGKGIGDQSNDDADNEEARGRRRKSGASRKGKERAVDEELDDDDDDDDDGEYHPSDSPEIDSREQSLGLEYTTDGQDLHVDGDDPADIEMEPERPVVDVDADIVVDKTGESVDKDDEDVVASQLMEGGREGRTGEEDEGEEEEEELDEGEGEAQGAVAFNESVEVVEFGPISRDTNIAHRSARRTLHSSPHPRANPSPRSITGVARKSASKTSTPAQVTEVVEESDVEDMEVEPIPPPSPPVSVAKPKQTRKRKDYHQMAREASPRVTRARSRSAAPVSPPRPVEKKGEDSRSRSRHNVPTLPESVKEEEEGEDGGARDMDDGIASAAGSAKTRKVEPDDEQSLRSLGLPARGPAETVGESGRGDTRRHQIASRQVAYTASARVLPDSRAARRSSDEAPGSPTTSTTSQESFPFTGTRASAVKRRYLSQERHTPYTPPFGTRAAAFSQTR